MLIKVDVRHGIREEHIETLEFELPEIEAELVATYRDQRYYWADGFYQSYNKRIVLPHASIYEQWWYDYLDEDDIEATLARLSKNYCIIDNYYSRKCDEPHIFRGEFMEDLGSRYGSYSEIHSLTDTSKLKNTQRNHLQLFKPEVFSTTQQLRLHSLDQWILDVEKEVQVAENAFKAAQGNLNDIKILREKVRSDENL